MNTDPVRHRAIIALLLVNLLWGISFPAMKAINMVMGSVAHSADHGWPTGGSEAEFGSDSESSPGVLPGAMDHLITASFLTCVRFAVSFGLLCVFLPGLFRGMSAAHWQMGIATGLAFTPGLIMQNVGLNYVPASRSGFLTSLTVVTTPLVVVALDRRLPRPMVMVGIVIGLMGTAILTMLVEVDFPLTVRAADDAFRRLGIGDWLTILAAFIFTVQILLIDRFSRRMPPGQLTPGMFAAAFGVGLIAFAGGHLFQARSPNSRVWTMLVIDPRFDVIVLVLSVFCTVLAFYWMNKYQAHVTPAQAALIYTTEPIFATIWAMILPGLVSGVLGIYYASERPGRELVIGGLFIALGNVLALWPSRPPRSSSDDLKRPHATC